MKKRNLLTLVLALVLVAALAVGGTLAYFTDTDTANNTFTMGKVDIKLEESNGPDENGKEEWVQSGLEYKNIVPGDTETKKARVTVASDSENCYVMVSVEITKAEDSTLGPDDITELYNAIRNEIGDDWTVTPTAGTGPLQCVYSAGTGDAQGVATKDKELMLFEKITIPTSFGNNTAGQTFDIVLNAYAVQSDNVNLADVDWDSTDFEGHPVNEPQA